MHSILIKMVGCENPQRIHMRLFASKALWYVASNIKVAMIPGSMQMVCSLLYLEREDVSCIVNISTETKVERGKLWKFIEEMWKFIYNNCPEYHVTCDLSARVGLLVLTKLLFFIPNLVFWKISSLSVLEPTVMRHVITATFLLPVS